MITQVRRKFLATKYDGSVASANEVESVLASSSYGDFWTITSHTVNGSLTIEYSGGTPTEVFSVGDYVISEINGGYYHVNSATFDNEWAYTRVAVGVAAIPTLLLLQTATVSVPLNSAFFDTTYDAIATPIGNPLVLASLQVTNVTKVDGDTVSVTVQNIGVATVSGASVQVTAVKN